MTIEIEKNYSIFNEDYSEIKGSLFLLCQNIGTIQNEINFKKS